MRQCLFCSLNANSLEDMWPLWITEQFEGSNPITVQAERQGLVLKPWASRRPELIVRWVCKSCNNGWMSNLEGQVKPLLQPLLSGTGGSLDSGAQSILAVWAVKTAMALEGLDKPNARAYTQSEREQLRKVNAIPRRTSVWLAVSVDASYLLSTKTRHKRSADTDDITGASTTMVFGHVALQVFTIRVPSFVTGSYGSDSQRSCRSVERFNTARMADSTRIAGVAATDWFEWRGWYQSLCRPIQHFGS
jgi:hypothetical protein